MQEGIPLRQKKTTRSSYRNKNNLSPDSGARPKKKNKNKNKKRYLENQKEKFRKSKEWKEFRVHMAKLFNHRDYITGRRLVKGFNVHHLKTEQDSETYCDISHDEEFIPLNSYCHKMLHYLFTHYRKDNTVIDRLVEILDRMCELMPENSDGVIDDNVDEYGEEDGELLEEEEEDG